MKIAFIYPSFHRHADDHPELREHVPCNEYLGPPSLGIASIAAMTPPEHEVVFVDDRLDRFDPDDESSPAHDADLFALSFFTPAATRALELGEELLARGRPVVMGGIFPSMMPEEAAASCTSVVVGEGESVWPRILQDAETGQLAPRYNGEIEDLELLPPPAIELYLDNERPGFMPDDYPLQLSRGCPLRCDACVLPHYLGKTIRFHSEANLRTLFSKLARAGKLASLTEDTSVMGIQGARRRLRRLLQLVIDLRAEGIPAELSYLGISMPMLLHIDDSLLQDLAATGIDRLYVVGGFDRITRRAFGTGDPSALDDARHAVARCHKNGLAPYVSFLFGNPDDDDRVFDRAVTFAHANGVDLAEFAISTPYPGTPLWNRYTAEGRIFDRTWAHYNDANVVFEPYGMDAETLQQGYLYAWREFYARRPDSDRAPTSAVQTVQF